MSIRPPSVIEDITGIEHRFLIGTVGWLMSI